MSLHQLVVHIIQMTLAVIGVALSISALRDSVLDLRALHEARLNGIRLVIAKWHIRNEGLRGLALLVLCLVGFGAAVWPDEVPFGLHDTLLTVILLGATVMNHGDRRTLYDIDHSEHPQRRQGDEGAEA